MIYTVPQYSGAQLGGGAQGGMLLSKEGLPPPPEVYPVLQFSDS